jgi:hypothetical protein
MIENNKALLVDAHVSINPRFHEPRTDLRIALGSQ